MKNRNYVWLTDDELLAKIQKSASCSPDSWMSHEELVKLKKEAQRLKVDVVKYVESRGKIKEKLYSKQEEIGKE